MYVINQNRAGKKTCMSVLHTLLACLLFFMWLTNGDLFSFNFKVTDLASQSFTCLLALLSHILTQNLGKANNEFLLNSCIPFLFFVYYFCRKTWQIYVVFHS